MWPGPVSFVSPGHGADETFNNEHITRGTHRADRVYSGFVSASLQFGRFVAEKQRESLSQARAVAAGGAGSDTCFIALRITLQPSERFSGPCRTRLAFNHLFIDAWRAGKIPHPH